MLILTKDFENATQRYVDDMLYLQTLVLTLQGKTFLDSIPKHDSARWKYPDCNCTAFAFDAASNGYMQPGLIASGKNRSNRQRPSRQYDYILDVHKDILKDGVGYLGNSLRQAVGRGIPAAVFFRDGEYNDYHWYVLRRVFNPATGKDDRLEWFNNLYENVKSTNGIESTIFSQAEQNNYRVFTGYYDIPHHLMGYRQK